MSLIALFTFGRHQLHGQFDFKLHETEWSKYLNYNTIFILLSKFGLLQSKALHYYQINKKCDN